MAMDAQTFCTLSAGAFFLVGLGCGFWKYSWIARTAEADARAPPYVDIAHRASLLYAFACDLLARLCAESAWPDSVNLVASGLLVGFFASAVIGYVVHGVLRDTDNQLRRPHVLGRRTVGPRAVTTYMVALTIAEIGAFGVLFAGFARAHLSI